MTHDVPQLPDGTVLLHIGPQKTGSTAIQGAMHTSRERLAEHGVLYPGTGLRPSEAGWAVMGAGTPVGRPAARMELWDQLVAEITGTTLPRACLSDEGFSRADDAAIERIVRGLGPERVHLVFVARRLDKLLPSHWQERVKARMTWSYPEFLSRMAAPDDGDWEWWMMWSSQEVGAVVDRWARHLDRSQMTVIVSDEDDHSLIPRTFAQLLGIPEDLLVVPPDRNNRSLTFPEAEAVREVNKVYAANDWTPFQYWRIVQAGLAGTLKRSPRTADVQPIPGLPGPVLEVVNDRADAQADAIKAAGVRVVGDPDRLRSRDRLSPDDSPGVVDTVSMELLGRVVGGVVDGALELQERTRRTERREAKARAKLEIPAPPDLGSVPARQLAAHLGRRAAGRLRRTLRRS